MKDLIVEQVINKLQSRSDVGIQTYNTTLKENNKANYLLELQHELLDAANYIEKLLDRNMEISEIVKNEPNDQELGKKIRKLIS